MGDRRDYVALDWVKAEIIETLKLAQQALEAYSELAHDAAQLRLCLDYVHQVHGTLQMVEFHGAALLAEEIENLGRSILDSDAASSKLQDDAHAVMVEAMVQLPVYLDSVALSRQQDLPILLLPILNDLRSARGERTLTISAFFNPSLSYLSSPGVEAQQALPRDDKFYSAGKKLRQVYQVSLVGVIRQESIKDNLERMRKVSLKLYQLYKGHAFSEFWYVSGAFVEGLLLGDIALGPTSKLLLREVDKELRLLIGDTEQAVDRDIPEDLLKNLLYYLAKSSSQSELTKSVKANFDLANLLPSDADIEANEQQRLLRSGRDAVNNVGIALREEVEQLKGKLDSVVRRDSLKPGLLKQLIPGLKKVADTMAVLGYMSPRSVVQGQIDVIERLDDNQKVSSSRLMDIASSLLQVEASLASLELASKRHAPSGDNRSEEALLSSQVVELQLNDAQKAVIREVCAGLDVTKESIQEFIKLGWSQEYIVNVPETLASVRGGLSMVPLDRAATILGVCEEYISVVLMHEGYQPDWYQLEVLADSISRVEYYLERLSGQDEDAGNLVLDAADKQLAVLQAAIQQQGQAPSSSALPAAALSNMPAIDDIPTEAALLGDEDSEDPLRQLVEDMESSIDDDLLNMLSDGDTSLLDLSDPNVNAAAQVVENASASEHDDASDDLMAAEFDTVDDMMALGAEPVEGLDQAANFQSQHAEELSTTQLIDAASNSHETLQPFEEDDELIDLFSDLTASDAKLDDASAIESEAPPAEYSHDELNLMTASDDLVPAMDKHQVDSHDIDSRDIDVVESLLDFAEKDAIDKLEAEHHSRASVHPDVHHHDNSLAPNTSTSRSTSQDSFENDIDDAFGERYLSESYAVDTREHTKAPEIDLDQPIDHDEHQVAESEDVESDSKSHPHLHIDSPEAQALLSTSSSASTASTQDVNLSGAGLVDDAENIELSHDLDIDDLSELSISAFDDEEAYEGVGLADNNGSASHDEASLGIEDLLGDVNDEALHVALNNKPVAIEKAGTEGKPLVTADDIIEPEALPDHAVLDDLSLVEDTSLLEEDANFASLEAEAWGAEELAAEDIDDASQADQLDAITPSNALGLASTAAALSTASSTSPSSAATPLSRASTTKAPSATPSSTSPSSTTTVDSRASDKSSTSTPSTPVIEDDVDDLIDDEVIEIFLEEAEEVLEAINEYWPQYAADNFDQEALTTVRRSFHTLKGSGRMVAAYTVGELAWSVEDLLNRVLDMSVESDDVLIDFIDLVRAQLPMFVEDFKEGCSDQHQAEADALSAAARALMQGEAIDVANILVPPPVAEASAEEQTDVTITDSQAVAQDVDTDESAAVASATPDMDPTLIQVFKTEAEVHQEVIREFVKLAKRSVVPQLFSEQLQRALHTLQGSANMAGLDAIAEVAAPMESYVKELRSYHLETDGESLALLEQVSGLIQYSISQLDKLPLKRLPGTDEFLFDLEDARESRLSSVTDVSAKDKQERASYQQLLQIFLSEGMDALIHADEAVAAWKNDLSDISRIKNLQQELNALYEAASAAEQTAIAELSLALYSSYNAFGSGLQPSEIFFDTVLRGHEVLINMMDQLAAGEVVLPADELVEALIELTAKAEQAAIDADASSDVDAEQQSTAEPETLETLDLEASDKAVIDEATADDVLPFSATDDDAKLSNPAADQDDFGADDEFQLIDIEKLISEGEDKPRVDQGDSLQVDSLSDAKPVIHSGAQIVPLHARFDRSGRHSATDQELEAKSLDAKDGADIHENDSHESSSDSLLSKPLDTEPVDDAQLDNADVDKDNQVSDRDPLFTSLMSSAPTSFDADDFALTPDLGFAAEPADFSAQALTIIDVCLQKLQDWEQEHPTASSPAVGFQSEFSTLLHGFNDASAQEQSLLCRELELLYLVVEAQQFEPDAKFFSLSRDSFAALREQLDFSQPLTVDINREHIEALQQWADLAPVVRVQKLEAAQAARDDSEITSDSEVTQDEAALGDSAVTEAGPTAKESDEISDSEGSSTTESGANSLDDQTFDDTAVGEVAAGPEASMGADETLTSDKAAINAGMSKSEASQY